MIILEYQGVEIDYCTNCGGIWLDGGELQELLKNHPAGEDLLQSIRSHSRCREKKIKCPVCHRKMEKITVRPGRLLVLDRCIQDHGIWCERGELEEILDGSSADGGNSLTGILSGIFRNQE